MAGFKNLFIVDTPEGGTRKSEQMGFSSATLLIFSVITLAGQFYHFDVPETQAMALAGGIVGVAGSLSGFILRLRSSGGTIKAKNKSAWIKADDDDSGWGVG